MVKVFTHTDLDGVGCSILAAIAFDKSADISYCDYDNIDPNIKEFIDSNTEYEFCIITDISVNKEVAEIINKKFNNFYLLDHHPTALWLNDYAWASVIVENHGIKTSGTEIFYYWLVANDYLKQSDALKRFVELVRDYDTWRWAELGEEGNICKQVNDLLYLYGREYFVEWCINQINKGLFPTLYPEDRLVLKIKQSEIDRYIEEKNKSMVTDSICERTCGFIFADRFISELGNKICKMHPEIDFVAIIDIDNCTVSYRATKDNVDLGKDIASLFGGGGHPKAAGSRFVSAIKAVLIKKIFDLKGEDYKLKGEGKDDRCEG